MRAEAVLSSRLDSDRTESPFLIAIHKKKVPPLATVGAAVRPSIGPSAVDVVLAELPHILAPVLPSEHPIAFLRALAVLAHETTLVLPLLNSETVLVVEEPLPSVFNNYESQSISFLRRLSLK